MRQNNKMIHKKKTTKRKKLMKIEMRKMEKMAKILKKKENNKTKKIIKSKDKRDLENFNLKECSKCLQIMMNSTCQNLILVKVLSQRTPISIILTTVNSLDTKVISCINNIKILVKIQILDTIEIPEKTETTEKLETLETIVIIDPEEMIKIDK